MIESLPEAGCGRSIDLRYTETVGQHGRHAQISNKARTVVRVDQTRMMQGRAKREKKPMTEGAVYVGVDVAKHILYCKRLGIDYPESYWYNPNILIYTD